MANKNFKVRHGLDVGDSVSITDAGVVTGISSLAVTTLDATNVEVTNIKAKDGTAAISIADSTGAVTVSSDLSIDNDITIISIDTFTSTGSSISGTTLTIGTLTSGTIQVGQTLSGGTVAAGTIITANISGSGSGSTWTVNPSQTVISSAISGAGNIVTVNSGVQTTKSFAAGNAAIGSSGEIGTVSTFDATGVASGATMQLGLRSENVTTGFGTTTGVIDHGQNRSGGTSTTAGSPSIFMESTRGTSAAPTATGSGDVLGALNIGGHDGVRGLASQVVAPSVQLIGLAGQAFLNNGTYTTQAGATTLLRSQPSNLRLTSTSRQNLFLASYTGGTTNTPPTQNLIFNNNSMSTQYDTAGNSINGHGRQDITFYHPTMTILGVPAESTANADNSTLPGSNVITFATSRQSGWSGRRDLVESGDTLAQIRVFGQTTNNSTTTGSQTGTIEFDAAETFSTTRRGSVFKIQTGDIGASNTLNNRLSLDSDNATFSTTKTKFATTGAANYGGEISMKAGIITGATTYDKTTELSVTALTADGTSNATYETKTLRSTDGVNYTPTQSGDVLGRFTFLGNYATATTPLVSNAAGNISVSATEAWTSGASGAAMKFNVNKTGTNTNISVLDLAAAASTFRSDSFTFQDSASTTYATVNSTSAKFATPVRTTITTASVAKGGTYTPAVTAMNSIILEITAGSGTTTIDVSNLTVAGENAVFDIMVYNNSGGSINANGFVIINGGNTALDHAASIANGERAMFEVNCVDIYANAKYAGDAV